MLTQLLTLTEVYINITDLKGNVFFLGKRAYPRVLLTLITKRFPHPFETRVPATKWG